MLKVKQTLAVTLMVVLLFVGFLASSLMTLSPVEEANAASEHRYGCHFNSQGQLIYCEEIVYHEHTCS